MTERSSQAGGDGTQPRPRLESLSAVAGPGIARQALLIGVVVAVPLATPAFADEGGNPFWTSGQYANQAAIAPPSGWSLPVQFYYYNGHAPSSATPTSAVTPGTRSQSIQFSLTP